MAYTKRASSWKPHEEDILISMFKRGVTPAEIAAVLKRSRSAVWKRVAKLRGQGRLAAPTAKPIKVLCPACGINKRAMNPGGTLRGWCRSCEVDQKLAYMRSEVGHATYIRWFIKKHGRLPRPRMDHSTHDHANNEVARRHCRNKLKSSST